MKKYIFNKLQEEIEAIDSQINQHPFIKRQIFNKYSHYIECISQPEITAENISNYKECAKKTEDFGKELQFATLEINEKKQKLYDCLNQAYIKSEDENLESQSNKVIMKEIDVCFSEFKKNVFLCFEKNSK